MWLIPDAVEEVKTRPSVVLKADGSYYQLEVKKEPIGFDLRSKRNADH